MVTPAAKREAVAHLRSAFDMSERRACRTIGCVRMTVRYRCHRPDDAELRARLRSLAHVRRRFGYRRLHVLLRREGFMVNHKRLFRLYREERLMVRRRGGRKRALGTRAPMLVPQWPNDRWSLDFVADQFIDGRRLRILVVVDDCTRECLALVSRHLDLRHPSGPRARPAHGRLRQAQDHRQRQRHRADLERHPAMDRRPQGRVAFPKGLGGSRARGKLQESFYLQAR
jgi:transposase InsO family protein